jgi:hypothetical protein
LYHIQDLSGIGSRDWKLKVRVVGDASMNVYVKLGTSSNPNQFDFDYIYKNILP